MHFELGMETDFFYVKVESQDIQDFAESIKSKNLRHFQGEAANKAGFSNLVAPPTFPILFWRYTKLDWLEDLEVPLIHGEQKFTYIKPIIAGDTYKCKIVLKDIKKKQGSTGVLWILQHVLEGYQDELLSFTSETNLILRRLDENEVK